jgi:hypothetical protein
MALRYETMKMRKYVVYREVGEIGLDYIVVEDRLYSINGELRFSDNLNDFVRWEVKDVLVEPKENLDVAEKAVYEWFKAQGHALTNVVLLNR